MQRETETRMPQAFQQTPEALPARERYYYPKYRDHQIELESLFAVIYTGSALPSNDEIRRLYEALHNADQVRDNSYHELLSKEYLAGLSAYLAQIVEELGGTREKPLTILEIGAGDGRLTHFLRASLEGIAPGQAHLVATDSNQWKIPTRYPVETLDYRKALQKYHPTIVITSWMPPRQDWTSAYRKTASVQEYLLIGEPDGDVCGSFATWGQKPGYIPLAKPAYQRDGFEMFFLEEVTANQFMRADNEAQTYCSATVSFRRMSNHE